MKDFRFKISDVRWIAGVLVVAAGLSLSLFAQQPQATPSAAVDQFVPMSEAAPREVLPAAPLVFIAYAFVWVGLIGYTFTMWLRMNRVEQDLAAVQKRLQDGAGSR